MANSRPDIDGTGRRAGRQQQHQQQRRTQNGGAAPRQRTRISTQPGAQQPQQGHQRISTRQQEPTGQLPRNRQQQTPMQRPQAQQPSGEQRRRGKADEQPPKLSRKDAKERERRRWRRKKSYGQPTIEERRSELSRYETGGVVTKRTSTRDALSASVLPVKDVPVIQRKVRRSNILSDVILVICLLVIVSMGSLIVLHQLDLQEEDNEMQNLAKTYTTTTNESTDNLPPAIDFDALRQINSDVSGWIYIPGTNVNYPIMSSTEKEKYLRRDIYGNKSVAGSIFTDWNNSREYTDEHIVLYGHHLPSDTMFTPVEKYVTQDGFLEEHRTVYIETPSTTYVLAVIGAYTVQPSETDTVSVSFQDTMTFQTFLDTRLEKCDKELQDGTADRRVMDKLFTLVTCTNDGKQRGVVEAIPVEVYPTSYVANVRKDAGATVTTVTVDAEAQQSAEEKASESSEDDSNEGFVMSKIKEFIYGLATRND